MATEEWQERQQVVQEVLPQADFNFPKIHLLSNYNTQIRDFGSPPQYSTEVTEALHKPLKDADRRSNHVNPTDQILDIITREHVLRIRELNIEVWSREYQVDCEILDEVRTQDSSKPTQDAKEPDESPMLPSNSKYARFGGKQASNGPEGTPMDRLAEMLMVPELIQHFYEYLRGLAVGAVSQAEVARFPTLFYMKLTVPVAQFQAKGIQTHNVWWTAGKPFRRFGKPWADWVWMRHRGRTKAANGELDGKIAGKLEGLFSVRDRIDMMHEVVLVSLLSLRGSSKPGGGEGMVHMGREMQGGSYGLC